MQTLGNQDQRPFRRYMFGKKCQQQLFADPIDRIDRVARIVFGVDLCHLFERAAFTSAYNRVANRDMQLANQLK